MHWLACWLVTVLAVALSCAGPASEDQAFVDLAEGYIEDFLERYPEHATALGDHRYDGRLNDYTSSGVTAGLAWNRHYLAELEAIAPSKLGAANAVDYEILRNYLQFSIWSAAVLREHEWNPMRYGVGDALYSLLARDFAPLEERLASLNERLQAVPAAVAAARTNLIDPPRTHTETAIRQNEGVIALLSEDLTEFLALAPGMEVELAAARAEALQALQAHGRWMREELLPRSTRSFRIGEELYRAKLAFTLQSDLTMEEILDRAQRRLAALQDDLYRTALPLYRAYRPTADKQDRADRPAVIRAVLDRLADSHPSDASIVEDARQALDEVTAFARANEIVSVPDEPLRIIVMPEFRRGVSTAYCDSPGPLETGGETFYAISPTPQDWTPDRKLSFYREYNDFMLQDLTVHEATPGHYLQLQHSNRLQAPTRIRSIFASGTFIEGWAVYAEQVMVEHNYGGAPFKMQQLKMLTRAVINAILDQQVHAGSLTEQEAMQLMMEQGFQEDGEAAGKWVRAQLTSAQLSTYFVGVAEHNDLRAAWTARHGPIQDWRAYHDTVLAFGSPPVRFVRSLLEL